MAKDLAPDHLLLTGDLCFREADPSAYAWVRQQVEAMGIPYDVLSGNHDDPVVMAEAFDRLEQLQGGELFFAAQVGDRRLICLDTTTGLLSPQQLSWLQQQLDLAPGEALVIMHHPPVWCGVPYMDNHYALQNQEAVQEILFRHSRPVHVFSGHYHADRVIHQRNLTVYLTPSCFVQISPYQEGFTVDHRRPALREIIVQDDLLWTTVRYWNMDQDIIRESDG